MPAELSSPKQRRSRTVSDENSTGNISPFAGGKAFPADMDAESMSLAAGKQAFPQDDSMTNRLDLTLPGLFASQTVVHVTHRQLLLF